MLSRRSMKPGWHLLLAGYMTLSPAFPALAGPLPGRHGYSSSTWGVSAFARAGQGNYGGGTGYLYTICDTFIFLNANSVPQRCGLNGAPYRGTSSIATGYNGVATVCPGESDYCAARTKLVSSEGLFDITEDAAVLPLGQPPNPQNYATNDELFVGLFAEDVMHVNSRRLPVGTPVEIETTFTEHGSERVVCGGTLNDSPFGGGSYNANSFNYSAILNFTGYNLSWGLFGECIGDQWYTKPMFSTPDSQWRQGFSASSKFLAHVGDALPFTSNLSTQAEVDDCDYTGGVCGGLVYSLDSAQNFTVTTQFQPLAREVTLSFDSGASYQ